MTEEEIYIKRVEEYLKALKRRILYHFESPNWSGGPLKKRMLKQYMYGHLEWLESFCKGDGFNMGCGELTIADSMGIDKQLTLATFNGAAYCDMENLWKYGDECADYIVSNYIGAILCPAKTFIEWHRVLKPGGVMALVCGNSDHPSYVKSVMGPLSRSKHGSIKKASCYNKNTIKNYLQFAGMNVESVEEVKHVLRVVAYK
jgi:SAM-dependent methyltransferase